MDASNNRQPPKILKPGVKDRLLFAVEKGASYQIASGFAGIAYNTMRTWVKRGEAVASLDLDPDELEHHDDYVYYEFVKELREVESSAALRWLDKIDKAANVHWQAAAWKLERRYPNEYGRTDGVANLKDEKGEIEKAKQDVTRYKSDGNG